MSRLTLLLVGSTAVDAFACLAILLFVIWRRRRSAAQPALTLSDVTAVAVVAAFVFVLKLPLMRSLGISVFGAFHLAYLDLAIVVPTMGILVLAFGWVGLPGKEKPVRIGPGAKAIAVLATVSGATAAYATFVEPHWLQIEETTVPIDGLAPPAGGVTVAVLADLQFARVTDYERGAIQRTMHHQPDVIVLPGDVFQGSEAAFEQNLADIRALLASLHAPGGVFLVEGNVDTPARLRRSVQGTEVRILDNEVVEVTVDGLTLAIGGVRWDFASSRAVAAIERLARRDGADARILLAHSPDVALSPTVQPAIDLMIAGHTHGGQVQIPGIGPLLHVSHIPRHMAAGGLSDINGTQLYVSRGVGCERGQAPLLRFLCRPEVSLLHLASQ